MKPESKNPNEKISPTVWICAYRRTFTDIPYSQDIFWELEKMRRGMGDKDIPNEFKTSEIAPQIEARYKLVNRFIQESGVAQIFELAAGLSSRGLEMTRNPAINYVESDLQEVLLQKKRIVNALAGKRPNLHLETANVLDVDTWQAAISYLDQEKPVAFVNEGLLRYLNFDQKVIVAKNIHSLLGKFGGLWITPDITLKKVVQVENKITSRRVEEVHQRIGINIEANCFKSVDDAQKFFENLGFSIERHSFMEIIDKLVSPQKLGQSKERVEALLKDPVVFVMRAV